MASGFDDYIELANSVNALSESIQAIQDRKEEQKRYEKEQQRLDAQEKTEETWRQKNYEMQQSAFDYQKWLNKTQREREDTSFQRSMADYKAAGVSGLGALGSSAPSGQLTSLPAPQMDTTGSRDVLNSRINSNRNRNQSRLERYKTTLGLQMQLKQLRLEKTNQVLQGLKLGNDILSEKKKRESLQADIDYKTKELEYNEKHGFRNQNLESSIIALADYWVKNRGDNPTIKQAEQKVKDTISNVGDSLGLTQKGRDEVVTVSASKYHQNQSPKQYLLSQKNALDVLTALSKNKTPNFNDIQSIWNNTPYIHNQFNNDFSNFQKACNSKEFIKDYILK